MDLSEGNTYPSEWETRPAKSSIGQPMNISTPMPIAYITAVKAIQAATNLALGFALRLNTPLIIIPKPITKIPPTPAKKRTIIKIVKSLLCSFLLFTFVSLSRI